MSKKKADEVEIVKDPAEVARIKAEQQKLAMALFAPADEIDEKKLVRRNTPQLVKPEMVPIGSAVSGTIVDAIDSPNTTIKGKLLWIRHDNGTEFTFPVTGVIRNALVPGKKEDEVLPALKLEVGKFIVCKRLPDKASKYAKAMFVFDVFTTRK